MSEENVKKEEKKKEGVQWGERDAELQESMVYALRPPIMPILFIIIGVAIVIIVIWLLLGV